MDEQRWQKLMQKLCLSETNKIYAELIDAYGEIHRYYHNLDHLESCLGHLDQVISLLEKPEEVELTLWFHDAIYQPHSATNEFDSAQWLKAFLENQNSPKNQIQRIYDHIMATQGHSAEINGDRQFVVDIDLAILGSSTETFQQFEQNIRKEYLWVPEREYRKKRAAVLSSFLQKPTIYQTNFFQERYEAIARKNLTRAIASLQDN